MQPNKTQFLSQRSGDIAASLHRDMDAKLHASRFSTQERLALACRYLADEGHAPTLAGQVTVRQADGTFWTTGFGAGFGDCRVGNLVRVDEEMTVVEGEGMPNPAVRFHLWVYAGRPDLGAIVHTHPPHASVLAMAGQPLEVSHMDMMMFHDDVAMLWDWPGVPLANEEGRLISEALGDKNSILLANHGILTAGADLDGAVFRAVHLEHAARLQCLCRSAGYAPLAVDPELASEARRFVTAPKFIEMTFDYWCRQALRRHPDALG